MDKICVSVKEMGTKMGISRSVAYELANRKDFYPAFRLGQRILVRVKDLERWISEQEST